MVALRLLEQGERVVALTMRAVSGDAPGKGGGEDVDRAACVAERLGIPHHVLDLRETFEKRIVAPFVEAYRAASKHWLLAILFSAGDAIGPKTKAIFSLSLRRGNWRGYAFPWATATRRP